MKFEAYLQEKKSGVAREIKIALRDWEKSIAKQELDLKELFEILSESNQGGKTIRGALVILGYELFAAKKSKEIYTLAAAYEILQTSLLIHDDIMDKSLLRRGRKTLMQELGGNHYALSQAISLGDVGFFLATKMISETNLPDGIKAQVLSHFSHIVLDTILGQMLDVKLSNIIGNVDEADVLKVAALKTAGYTIAGPLHLGALVGGASAKQIAVIDDFGTSLGIAFQLTDDILGVFGNEKTVGKSVTSDIEEGKKTLLFVHALANASEKQKKILGKSYGHGKISNKQHDMIKRIFEEIGSRAYVEERAQEYLEEAKKNIGRLTPNKNYQGLLHDFIAFLLTRKK